MIKLSANLLWACIVVLFSVWNEWIKPISLCTLHLISYRVISVTVNFLHRKFPVSIMYTPDKKIKSCYRDTRNQNENSNFQLTKTNLHVHSETKSAKSQRLSQFPIFFLNNSLNNVFLITAATLYRYKYFVCVRYVSYTCTRCMYIRIRTYVFTYSFIKLGMHVTDIHSENKWYPF